MIHKKCSYIRIRSRAFAMAMLPINTLINECSEPGFVSAGKSNLLLEDSITFNKHFDIQKCKGPLSNCTIAIILKLLIFPDVIQCKKFH